MKRLEQLLPVKKEKESDGIALFEHVMQQYESGNIKEGIVVSSGCVSCNNGGGIGSGVGGGVSKYESQEYKVSED
jgi:hypothetical protein